MSQAFDRSSETGADEAASGLAELLISIADDTKVSAERPLLNQTARGKNYTLQSV